MKNKFNAIILMLPLMLASSFSLGQNFDGPCEKTTATGDIIKVSAASGSGNNEVFRGSADNSKTGDACSEIPDAYRVKVFKFGLCSANPFTSNDFSTCSFFLENDNGVSSTIEGALGTKAVLPITSQVAPGEYDYILLLLSNSFDIKHTQSYGSTVYSNPNGSGETSGTTCWSVAHTTAFGNFGSAYDSKGTSSDGGVECGDAGNAVPAFTTEIFDTMGDSEGVEAFVHTSPSSMSVGGNAMWVKLLQDDNATTATSYTNAKRMLVSINTAATKVVTSSSSVDIKLKLTDSVSVDSSYTGGKTYIVKLGADPIQVDVVVTN